jgi:hypothetical protein
MRLGLALGAAVIATTMVAYADSDNNNRRFVFHRGEPVNADTNNDGWLSRDEAGREADRLFADLDRDNNSRLTDEDGELLSREIEVEVERAMEGVEIEMEALNLELEGLDEEIERDIILLNDSDCETTTETENGQTRTTTVCRSDDDDRDERARGHSDRARDHAERIRDRVERRVHVIRHGDGNVLVAPVPPVPPTPPIPVAPPVAHLPMFWMGGGDSDESDLNGDGWLSREEFRAQQLRHFDARDANGDGRVRYEQPPRPPEPPQPPEPPRRR